VRFRIRSLLAQLSLDLATKQVMKQLLRKEYSMFVIRFNLFMQIEMAGLFRPNIPPRQIRPETFTTGLENRSNLIKN